MRKKKYPPLRPMVFTNAVEPAVLKPNPTKKGTERGKNAEITDAMFKRALRDRKKS